MHRTGHRWLGRLVTGLALLGGYRVEAAPPPRPTALRSGELTFRLRRAAEGEPWAGVDLSLRAPYPRARPLRARTDAQGTATVTASEGNYLMEVDGMGIGLVQVTRDSPWRECVVVVPPDYSWPPPGRPDLRAEPVGERLVLFAEHIPVAGRPPPAPRPAAPAPPVSVALDGFLRRGQVAEALAAFADPPDPAARFSLAVAQVLDGMMRFSRGLTRLPLNARLAGDLGGEPPFLRFADPESEDVEVVTPEKVGALFTDLRAALRRANRTVAEVGEADFRVEVNLSRIRLDVLGDGQARTLAEWLDLPIEEEGGGDVLVRFDSADAKWLEGYTHLLGGVLDVILAYDWRPLWDHVAPLLFARYRPEPPFAAVARAHRGPDRRDEGEFGHEIDWFAALHAFRLPLADPAGLRRARDEIAATVACSRESWRRILAETDDDREWIPSPRQTGPGGTRITEEEVAAWMRVLDEVEAILEGRRLIPHWRLRPGVGVNLARLVEAPPPLDPVMFIQGSALAPYAEPGAVSDGEHWAAIIEAFGDRFLLFLFWVN